MDQQLLEQFAALFVGRTDAAGVWDHNSDTTYVRREAVTLQTYAAHLSGRRSLGVFPLRNDGTTRWLAFDVDTGSFETAAAIRDALNDLGLSAYIETSKGKGYHVWVFFADDTPASACRRLAQHVLRAAGAPQAMEVFPKQSHLSMGQIGNFINLPYWPGVKGTPDDKRIFLDLETTGETALSPMNLADFLTLVHTSVMPAQFLLAADALALPVTDSDTFVVGSTRRGTYDGDPPTCVQHAMATSVAAGEARHDTGIRLVGYWRGMCGLSDSEVLEKLEEWNTHNDQPLSHERLRQCLERNDKYSWGCSRLREVAAFRDGCSWSACQFYKESDDETRDPSVIALDSIVDETAQEPVAAEPTISFRDEREIADLIASSGWLKDYVDYARQTTAAPRIIHAFTALAALSAVMGNRVAIASYGDATTFANLYVAIVCPSGWYHKSTATGIGLRLIKRAVPDALLPDEMTPESLTTALVQKGGSGLWCIDELGAAMSGWNKRDYLGGMKGKLTSYFDNRPTGRFIKGAKGAGEGEDLDSLALGLLGTTTVDWLQDELRIEDLRAGFPARMLWVWAEHKEREPDRLDMIPSMPKAVSDFVERVANIGTTAEPARANFAPIELRYQQWLRQFQAETEDNITPEISGVVSRVGVYVRKLAAIFAVSDLPIDALTLHMTVEVTAAHLNRAIAVMDWCLARQRYLVREMFQFSQFDRAKRQLFDALRREGGLITYASAVKVMRQEKDKTDKLIATLRASGELRKGNASAGKKGRPKIFVCWPQVWPVDAQEVA